MSNRHDAASGAAGPGGERQRFMTGAEVAELLRTSESTVRYWKHIGKLAGVRIGKRTLYAAEDVEALIAAAASAA